MDVTEPRISAISFAPNEISARVGDRAIRAVNRWRGTRVVLFGSALKPIARRTADNRVPRSDFLREQAYLALVRRAVFDARLGAMFEWIQNDNGVSPSPVVVAINRARVNCQHVQDAYSRSDG